MPTKTRPPHSAHLAHLGIRIHPKRRPECSLLLRDRHRNSASITHGGVVFSMADVAMALAVLERVRPGQACSTIDARISYLRPAVKGKLVAKGELIAMGRTVAHAEATITCDGKTVARAQGTFAVHDRR